MDFLLPFGSCHYMDLFRAENPYFSKEGKGDISKFAKGYLENYASTNGKGLICIPSGNHDIERISQKLDAEELKVAFAFIMSMPGAPFIYYGDEIGMNYVEGLTSVEGGYHRTGSRTPMQWNNDINDGFSNAKSEQLYIKQDSSSDRPTVKRQQEDENSLWKEVQKLIKLRMGHEPLCSNASIEILYAEENAYPFVYRRTGRTGSILVVLNPSEFEATCDIPVANGESIIYFYNAPAALDNGKLTVPPCSATFIKVK
ncbi:alpha-amylase family glycosyl hydrolase [Clostridium oryzae]|uniref:Glucan 1,6-alpha-glucosidase n=1 Tax=Clostridium oryzae TaxID=1450648 RepID=A0A1V4IDS3_9CLOT|nr:glucan 1,6-alpha-glucosidase [Clostridium oryzae]